ncbi:uncharacterized protein L969DRAFT_76407 [Mixia osmundae IAM 14324]|uniref:Uncharacterized protein n=1 Tax=Mixia osmundae (strain CBS 9802 / IAM 14324 / JCM 22182 / KY 12970) TaxID=764103 RepID=G7E0H6_MIXOS|nr:uncharacterized protein L969DRAFT_76407 [Mixia osmundae IAM 14324]KEI38345.1 hypothetical protein L969DRAFT_76407 [Mixia osmundae IAM 14324]GAA96336.1 hypothetical protein E5Q_03002 [Mixia osmundae IAM 14324]
MSLDSAQGGRDVPSQGANAGEDAGKIDGEPVVGFTTSEPQGEITDPSGLPKDPVYSTSDASHERTKASTGGFSHADDADAHPDTREDSGPADQVDVLAVDRTQTDHPRIRARASSLPAWKLQPTLIRLPSEQCKAKSSQAEHGQEEHKKEADQYSLEASHARCSLHH